MIKLFEGEKIVSQTTDNSVILTTHRICYEYSAWGNSYNQNIMLEHITSSENSYSSNLILLLLSNGSLIAGFLIGEYGFAIGFLFFIAFALVYKLTKQNNIIIASPSARMKIAVNGMKREKILDFIDLVEETKNKRILNLKN